MPILEPEVSIKSPDKKGAEAILLEELKKALDALPAGRQVMFKLTLPDVPDLYLPLVDHPRVARVVALSGGYTREDACKRLAANHGIIASFSRALVRGSAGFDERRRIRSRLGALDRRNLQRLNRKGVTPTALPVLGPAGAPIATIDSPRRAPPCAASFAIDPCRDRPRCATGV